MPDIPDLTAGRRLPSAMQSNDALAIDNGTSTFYTYMTDIHEWLEAEGTAVTKTGSYTLSGDERTVFLNAASGTITVPSGLAVGTRLHIEKISASAGTMTIARSGSETIQGLTSISITQKNGYAYLRKVSATEWFCFLYEKGTFTAGVSFGGGTTGITYTAQEGYYERYIGSVIAKVYITLTSKGSSVGVARLTGFPVTASTNARDAIQWGYVSGITANDTLYGIMNNGGTTAELYEKTTAGVVSQVTNADFTDTAIIMASVTYIL